MCSPWWGHGIMMTSSNGNIFRVTGHLCGEFIGPRWTPHTKASGAELCHCNDGNMAHCYGNHRSLELWCFFDVSSIKLLSEYSNGGWSETPWWSCDIIVQYGDVIMDAIASQITSLTIVYSIVYSDADQRKHQSSASLAFVWGIHRDRWIPHTKSQLRGKCFHLMTSSCCRSSNLMVSWHMQAHPAIS